MVLFLAILIAWLTAFSSLKDLIKARRPNIDEVKLNGWFVIIFFLIAICTTVYNFYQDGEQKKTNKNLVGDFTKSLDTAAIMTAVKDINRTTARIKNVTESFNDSLNSLINQKNSLLNAMHDVNKLLDKQVDIEKKLLKERSAFLEQPGSLISWFNYDSDRWTLKVPITNIGSRPCSVKKKVGVFYFVDEKNNPFYCLRFSNDSETNTVPPVKLGLSQWYYSDYVTSFSVLKESTKIGLLYLEFEYADVLTKEKITVKYFRIWDPKFGFGHSSTDQIKLTELYLKNYNVSSGSIK